MAHFWTLDDDDIWAVYPLGANSYVFTRDCELPLESEASANDSIAFLRRMDVQVGERWILLSARMSGIEVNGVSLPLGMKVLDDRDEMRFPGRDSRRVFFSTERLAAVQPFPGFDHLTCCPRCQRAVEKGKPAVQCPNPRCGVWYHQDETPCWNYNTTCAQCGQTTDLDAGFQWSPKEL